MVNDVSCHRMDMEIGSFTQKLVQCRICHDEDEDSNMETPCSCNGSLKYAHRKCVQRWCNEKGNITCEICRQQFQPGYAAPPLLFPLDFRGNWVVARRELQNPQFIAMVATDNDFQDSDFDEYAGPTSRSLLCCRVVAIIFMVLLVLRHTLPVIIEGNGGDAIAPIVLLTLRSIGILLPIYVMVRAFNAIRRRRHQESWNSYVGTSDEENEPPPELQLIRV